MSIQSTHRARPVDFSCVVAACRHKARVAQVAPASVVPV